MERILKPRGNNPLLVKNDVGRSKPSTFTLPSDEFIYGRPDRKDPEDAKAITTSWQNHSKSNPKEAGKDYLRMNKKSISNGISSVKALNDYQKHHEIRKENKSSTKHASISRVGRSSFEIVHGKTNRPSTPIGGVLHNAYGSIAEEESKHLYEIEGMRRAEQGKRKVIKQTRASMKQVELVKQKAAREADPTIQYKLKRFRNVEARVPVPQGNKGSRHIEETPAQMEGDLSRAETQN